MVNEPPRIVTELRDGVLRLTLSNPRQRNALTPDMLRSLERAMHTAGTDSAVRVVVIRGDSDVFSSGYAISSFPEGEDLHETDELTAAGEAIAMCAKPTVAVLNGDAIGAAFDLALAADFRLAVTPAKVGITPARFGIIYPWQGVQRAVDVLGSTVARRLLLTGELIDAQQAHEWGGVDEISSSPHELDATEERWIERLLGVAPLSVAGLKQILRVVARGEPTEVERSEILTRRREAIDSADAREAREAFRAKRKPMFHGR